MQTERFNSRKKVLDEIFNKQTMINTWRDIVRNQLREMEILDIFDHYDFNYNIEARSLDIRNEILNGTYKATQPLFYRKEKKYGICRHLVIPQPVDALVLQVLIETVYKDVIDLQPSKKAFFSRDRSRPKSFDKFVLSSDYFWNSRWKAMQTQIYNFNDTFKYIVTTDLSNYYDSIHIDELRKVFSSYKKIDEVVVDLIFNTLEQISWTPDYLPYSHRGLPTSNIEAIRLLSHLFLFEIDKVLMDKTNDNFVRWMDDIVFGTDDKKKAIEILSTVSDMLKSRGLSFNLAKTNIYSDEEGSHQFQLAQNDYLNGIFEKFSNNAPKNYELKNVYSNFKKHYKNKDSKYWDKIVKRYITFFGKHKCTILCTWVCRLYLEFPILRENLIIYLSAMNYSNKTADILMSIIENINIFDDISLFQLTNLVTTWIVPCTTEADKFLTSFENKIMEISKTRKLPTDFFCLLWFKAKYKPPELLFNFIQQYQNIWQKDLFLRRQVTGVFARIYHLKDNNKMNIAKLFNAQFLSGNINVVTLASQIKINSQLDSIDNKFTSYLFNKNLKKPYSLQRFLVLCSVLNSEKIRNNKDIREKIVQFIIDPYYLKWLEYQYFYGGPISTL